MILLDTHILVRYAAGDRKLGRRALAAIEKALKMRRLHVSAISFWEIAMLVAKGKLKLASTPIAFRGRALSHDIVEFAVDGDVGIHSAELNMMHGDLADRLIVATAIVSGATLVTCDGQILGLKVAGLRCLDGAV